MSVGGTAIPAPREIRIHVHPEPIKVSYATIRRQLPVIIDEFARNNSGSRPDLILHIGIASTRKYYSVETQAHRDNYRIPDVEGRSGYNDGEKIWRGNGLPLVLFPGPAEIPPEIETNQDSNDAETSFFSKPALEISPYPANEHFLQVWNSYSPAETDLRLSSDAGRYLCEFIFYSSLSHCFQEGRDRSVIFYHVPVETDAESLDKGTKVAVALIKSMVKCWIDGE